MRAVDTGSNFVMPRLRGACACGEYAQRPPVVLLEQLAE